MASKNSDAPWVGGYTVNNKENEPFDRKVSSDTPEIMYPSLLKKEENIGPA